MHACPTCQSARVIHNGSAAGKPKKQCKQCGDQFTRTTPRGKPLATKIHAVLWYVSGMSMHRIAFLLRVSAQAVLTWIRDCAKDDYEKPEPTGRTIVLAFDEMWHSLKKKRHKLWIWKALDRDTGQLLDWECGRRDKATLKKMVDRLAQWEPRCASLTPYLKLSQFAFRDDIFSLWKSVFFHTPIRRDCHAVL